MGKLHLDGKKRIGVFPIKDDKVKWGCIDIDPRNYADYSSKKYIDIIKNFNLPLVAIKSKSGGLHLFLFFKEWTERDKASEILDDWNNKYFGSKEVFHTRQKVLICLTLKCTQLLNTLLIPMVMVYLLVHFHRISKKLNCALTNNLKVLN